MAVRSFPESCNTYTHVSGNALDTLLVDYLVTGEESQSVGVVLEALDDTEDLLEVDLVVGRLGRGPVNGSAGQGRVDIENHVDAGRVEDGGTLIVVEAGVEVVDTDSVDLVA